MRELSRHRGDSVFRNKDESSAKKNDDRNLNRQETAAPNSGGPQPPAFAAAKPETGQSPFRNASASSSPNKLNTYFTDRETGSMPVYSLTDVTSDADPAEPVGDVDDADETDDESEYEAPQTIFRDSIHSVGPISIEYFYIGEVFNNARGGISTQGATRYRGNFDIAMSLDTEQANWWSGGEVFLYFQQSHGRTLTADFVGDGQYYSNIDTVTRPADFTRLGEVWYQHTSWDASLSVKFGLQDPNCDFAYVDLGGDFINSSFVTIPNVPMPYWAFQTLGVSSLYQHNSRLRLGGGVYEQGRDVQQWWATVTDPGLFYLAQADYEPFADCENALLTLFKFGSWFTSSDTESVDGSQTFDGNYGFYATVDRALFTECCDEEQGLSAFFQASWAPADRNQVDRSFAAGLVYRGLIDHRDEDTCGIAYTGLFFSDELNAITGQTSEDVMEVFYKARLRPWLSIQPDVQYIARPYGLERDALVTGFRFEAVF